MTQKTPCSRCGYLNRVNEVACLQCGTRFNPVATAAVVPPAPAPYAPPSGPSAAPAYGVVGQYVQGYPPPGIWRDGKKLVCTNGAVFPDQCVKCGERTTYRKLKKMIWYPKWIAALGAIPLAFLILYFLYQKKGEVEFGLCDVHRNNQVWMVVVGAFLLVVGGGGFAYTHIYDPETLEILFGVVGFVGLLLLAFSQTLLAIWPDRIDDNYLWINGASEEFRNRFPPIR